MQNNIAKQLLDWYDQHGRHDLPWQQNRTAYTVWVSEIMLQQTQVATVIPYYQKFIKKFPTVTDLAQASIDTVLEHWSGLGYYARGRNLHKAAQIVAQDFNGNMPQDFNALHALPGIGRSTAGAIMAQAYQQPYAILDGNVKRVLARLYCVAGWPGNKKVADALWIYAEKNTPQKRVDDYTQAIMDLGATLCKRSKPSCNSCPLHQSCQAYASNTVADYPTKKPKKVLPVKTVQLLMVQKGRHLLLEKRPPTGIWGGLLSFPEVAAEEDSQQWWQQSPYAGLGELEIAQICPQIRHSFSHYHLDIIPVLARLGGISNRVQKVQDQEYVWHEADEAAGLPAPIKKLITLYSAA